MLAQMVACDVQGRFCIPFTFAIAMLLQAARTDTKGVRQGGYRRSWQSLGRSQDPRISTSPAAPSSITSRADCHDQVTAACNFGQEVPKPVTDICASSISPNQNWKFPAIDGLFHITRTVIAFRTET